MIQTVNGKIKKNQSGNVLMHEHIQCVSNDMLTAFGSKWLDENKLENYSVAILNQLKLKINLGIFVDGTSIDLGRNVRLLKRISDKTGVNIVASTGLYYYPSMVTSTRSAEELSYWFMEECENGMEGTDIKPGILKCAVDYMGMTEDTKKRVTALAFTQAKTGLPLYAHCSHTDNLAQEMIDIFNTSNANPNKIIIGHASRRLDVSYLENILKEGYYICIDQSCDGEENTVAKIVYKLCEKGFDKQILFSHDRSLYNDFEHSDRLGLEYPKTVHIDRYSFLQNKVIPELKNLGCSDNQLNQFLRDNALDILDI